MSELLKRIEKCIDNENTVFPPNMRGQLGADELKEHPVAVIGLSALLATTMVNMKKVTK